MEKVKFINQEQAEIIYSRLPKPSKFIFAIGIETGLRISDILRLKWRDIENPMRVWIGRTKEIREFPLSDWLYNELISYVDGENLGRHIFISPRKRYQAINRTTYHRHIKKALEGLMFDCSAHSSRKYYLCQEKKVL
jgi:integrase